MKFNEVLEQELIGEWRDKYIKYKALKKLIKGQTFFMGARSLSGGDTKLLRESEFLKVFMESFTDNPLASDGDREVENSFFSFLEENIVMIQLWYEQNLVMLQKRLRAMRHVPFDKSSKATKRALELELSEIYRALGLLERYCILNKTGLVKILKKHDKASVLKTNSVFMSRVVELTDSMIMRKPLSSRESSRRASVESERDIGKDPRPTALMSKLSGKLKQPSSFINFMDIFETRQIIEDIWTLSVGRNKDMLRGLPDTDKGVNTFFSGMYTGITIPLLAVMGTLFASAWPCDPPALPQFWNAWPVFRFFFFVAFHALCHAVCLVVWKHYKVNYVFILRLQPATHMHHHQVIRFANGLFLLSCVVFTLYLYASLSGTDANFANSLWGELVLRVVSGYYSAYIIFGLCMLILFVAVACPWLTIKWLFYRLYRILFPVEVTFCDSYLADQLTSEGRSLEDICYSLAYIFTGAFLYPSEPNIAGTVPALSWIIKVVLFIPPWLRFVQCMRRYYLQVTVGLNRNPWPHVANSLKYFLSMMVILSSRSGNWVAWIVIACISSLYSYVWDLTIDWSLLQKNSSHYLLREKLMYPAYYYYMAAVLNLALRFCWAITISPGFLDSFVNPRFMTLIFGLLEIFRRFIWSLLRLENEQVSNSEGFRAIMEVPSELFSIEGPVSSTPALVKLGRRASQLFSRSLSNVALKGNDGKEKESGDENKSKTVVIEMGEKGAISSIDLSFDDGSPLDKITEGDDDVVASEDELDDPAVKRLQEEERHVETYDEDTDEDIISDHRAI